MKLSTKVLKRGFYLLFLLFAVPFLTFTLVQWIPGDPAEIFLRWAQENPSPEQMRSLKREWGLDRPLGERYLQWLGGAVQGDLGRSWRTGRPVFQEIAEHFPATLELTVFSFLLILLVSTGSGFWAAFHRDRWIDRFFGLGTAVFLSFPNFWLGTLLIYFLGWKLQWFPLLGRGGMAHLFLPVITLAVPVASLQGRILRTRILELLDQEYIRFARAKGLRTGAVIKNHLIRNALPTMISLWGLTLGSLLGGSFVVESLFAWPGLGRLTVEAVLNRDQPLIQGTILLFAFIYGIINQIVEGLQKVLDPRLSTEIYRPEEGAF